MKFKKLKIGSNENIFGAKLNKGITQNQKSSHWVRYISNKISKKFQKYGKHTVRNYACRVKPYHAGK